MTNDKNDSAKKAIKDYLDRRATTDNQFAVSYAKKGKSLDECFRYILGEARSRGNSVFMTDEEVYGLAVHYFDEDKIKIKSIRGVSARVAASASASTPAPLSEEEKAQARENARKAYEELCLSGKPRRG